MERYLDGKPLACRSCCCVLWWCLPRLEFGEIVLNAKNVDRVEDCGNGFGWSIIHFDDEFYGNCYEFAVLRDGALCYDSGVTSDVVRGDWTLMDKLKCMVQDLHPDRLAS